MEMAYFGMWFLPILKKAVKRGVEIKILASREADTNHDTNIWFLSKLLKLKKNNLSIYLSDDMIHTKGMVNTNKVILGAANFHSANGYFKAINEQNIYSENKELVKNILDCFEKDISESIKINSHFELPEFSKIKALKERASIWLASYFVFFNRNKIQKHRNSINTKLQKNWEALSFESQGITIPVEDDPQMNN